MEKNNNWRCVVMGAVDKISLGSTTLIRFGDRAAMALISAGIHSETFSHLCIANFL